MIWSISATGLCVFMALLCILSAKFFPGYEDFLFGKSLIWVFISVIPWAIFVVQVIIESIVFTRSFLERMNI